uniref:ATP synthase F0 subunit 8 n=1 Tax=Pleurosicya micheli TaxID=595630 RepID=UPI0028FC8759|nr:ATP synthase F0 subunit 8 [Pleurosicya micheli]WNH38098.1 ATP synthase F0 subunit 8 [Pleurosicya micheli]
MPQLDTLTWQLFFLFMWATFYTTLMPTLLKILFLKHPVDSQGTTTPFNPWYWSL